MRHSTPIVVTIMTPSIAIVIVIAMTITTRMRIALVIIQRIPADVVTERDVEHERDQRRTPPTAVVVELAARAPRPVTVEVNPTAVVIRRPAPRLVANPRPAIRRTPGPLPVTIRRPIAVDADRAGKRTPDPTVVVSLDPIAIGLEILAAPNVFVVILVVVLQSLREIAFAFRDPIIDLIRRPGDHEIPVACVFAVDDELRCTTVTERETGSV
jgi:hypothetical protein